MLIQKKENSLIALVNMYHDYQNNEKCQKSLILFMTSISKSSSAQNLGISNERLLAVPVNVTNAIFPGQHVIWTDDLRTQLPIRLGSDQISAVLPTTLIDEWKRNLSIHASRPALSVKRHNKWETISYREYFDECIKFAKALLAIGCGQFATVNIIGFNTPQWAITYYGSMFAKCIPVGIYSTNSQTVCEYIAKHSESRIIVTENIQYATKYFAMLERGQLDRIVIYGEQVVSNNFGGRVVTWKEFMNSGKDVNIEKVYERMASVRPGNCCTLIYTSGTTGMPKGVMLSHDNMTWSCKSSIEKQSYLGKPFRLVSYLPLSHCAAQFIDIVLSLFSGYQVFFADRSALQETGNLIKTLQEVKPHMFFAVPRIWVKIYDKIVEISKSNDPLIAQNIVWARSIGEEGTLQEARNQQTSQQFKKAKIIVYNPIKDTLGLNECQSFKYGAAPIDPEIRKYFFSINIFLRNGYGMTECTCPQNVTDPFNIDFLTPQGYLEVGCNITGTQMKIHKQKESDKDGEICMRGRNTFMGYFKNAEETSKTIDSEGYLHSGDNGRVTKEGVLFITGRIKELIITAGGENIPPVLIENEIKNFLPCVSNAMVIGDNRKFLTCLLTLKEDPPQSGTLESEARKFLSSKEVAAKTVQEAISHPSLRNVILEGLNTSNSKAISRAQYVQDFIVLSEDFSVLNGLLTPTLKLKRKQVLKVYAAQIDALYIKAKL